MLPQISTVELRNAQNRDDKLHPLIWYLKDGTLPKDAPTGQCFLSDNEILNIESLAGKRTIIQLVVLKTLQTELLHWWQDHFTSDHLGLNKTYERLRSTYFWNNVFAGLQHWIKPCVSSAQMKKRCSPLQTSSSPYSRLRAMESYCCRLYGSSSSHEFGKSIHSYCGWPLYKVYQDCSLTFNRNYYHKPGVFG